MQGIGATPKLGVYPPLTDVSYLTVCEYQPYLHEKVVALYTTAMLDNKASAQDDHTRNLTTELLKSAVPQFDNLDTILCTKNGGKMFLAITPSDDVVGMFAVSRSDEDVKNNEVEFRRISVTSSWRKQGVCRLLHDRAMQYSRDKLQAKRCYLVTLSSVAPVMKAYTALGFRKGYDNVLDHRGFDVETDVPVFVRFWKPL